MNSKIDIRFRKGKIGPELDLVNTFLKSSRAMFSHKCLEVTHLIEPYAEAGIPDLVLVFWDKNACNNWCEERNLLTKDDIKILHHISIVGKDGIDIDEISYKLFFSEKSVLKSVNRLVAANLIRVLNKKAVISDFDKNFFIKKIISIEAKVSNWKSAISQAQLNENFASHSYVLLPADIVTDKIVSYFEGSIGLLAQSDSKPLIKKRASKTKIPSSYYSWILNEYLGRQCFNEIKINNITV